MKNRFNKALWYVIGAIVLSFGQTVNADIILLVHGFQSDILTWKRSQVVTVLEKHGWQATDYLLAAPEGIVPIHTPEAVGNKKIVNLQLNSEIGLRTQANMFTAALYYLADQYPDEPVIVVGHSLGGLTARLALVKNGVFQVKALITIASPHLGTGVAYKALDELSDNFFISSMKKMFGGGQYQMLQRSQSAIFDILPEQPGNMLYALNRQPHPDIAYYSVVRTKRDGRLGDDVVPGFSQDMKSVAALRNKSKRILQGFQHDLTAQDGYTILNVIEELK